MQKPSMLKTVLSIFRDSLSDIWGDLWTTLVCNAIWLFANLLIIPGPPATMALYYYANQKAHGEEVDHKDFWKALGRSWSVGWRWGAFNLFFLTFLVANIYLSSKITNLTFMSYMQGLYIAIGLGWFLLKFFALPFLYEQENKRIGTALRNSAVMIGRNPVFSLLILLFLLITLIVSTLVSLLSVMFGAIFTAFLGTRAILNRLELLNTEELNS